MKKAVAALIVLLLIGVFGSVVNAEEPRLCLEFTDAYQDEEGFWVLSPESDLVITVTQCGELNGLFLMFVDLDMPVGPNYPTGFIMWVSPLTAGWYDGVTGYRYQHNMAWLWPSRFIFTVRVWTSRYNLSTRARVRVLE